jgi:hypothetical protein
MSIACNMLENSKDTIRHLSVFTRVYSLSKLWPMRFPSLHTLQLSAWWGLDPDNIPNMSNFILSHFNTLEVLDFSTHRFPDECEFDLDLFPFIRPRNQILDFGHQTHLRSFRGSAVTFFLVLDSGLQSMFSRLENLELDDGNMLPSQYHALVRSDNTHRMPTIFTLRRLCIALYSYWIKWEEQIVNNWVIWPRLLIEQCRMKLEIFMLNLPIKVDPEILAELLGQADSLKTIYLSAPITSGYEDEEYVKVLTSCVSLREVWLYYEKWSKSYAHLHGKELYKSTSMVRIERDILGEVIDLHVVKPPGC